MTASIPSFDDHSFLAEELLIPSADKTDGGRANMVCSHTAQILNLVNPEPPSVFTNFENQIGEHSSGIKRITKKTKVLSVLEFNKNHKLVVTKDEDNLIHLVEWQKAVNLTESFGYQSELNPKVKAGKVITPTDGDADDMSNDWIVRNSMYDDQLNFQYGVNLKSVYIPYFGFTYEDAIVISETAAEKLSHHDVCVYYIVLNRNDVLVNSLGTSTNYKGLPDIGERVTGGLLCARRRIQYATILDEFKDTEFSQIRSTDTSFHADGEVMNIEVFCNTPEDLEYPYNAQFKKIVETQHDVYTAVLKLREKYADGQHKFSDDFSFWCQKAADYLNREIPFSYDKSEFEGMVLRVTVSDKIAAKRGTKITGRYGNKG